VNNEENPHPRVQGHFEDKYVLYKFWFDCEGREARSSFTLNERRVVEREFAQSLAILCQVAPDAHLRSILTKKPAERTEDDISLVFDELIQISALSELTASVKQELAHVISYEFHLNKGTVGKYFYIFSYPLFLLFSFFSFHSLTCHVFSSNIPSKG